MASLNTRRTAKTVTHEGGPAVKTSPIETLHRQVLSCFLFEDTFYEGSSTIASQIQQGVKACGKSEVLDLALRARSEYHLRHVPLWLLLCLAREGRLTASVLTETIQRPDEIAEFLAMYWKDGKRPIAAQVKKGLARAFTKFSPYALAKYNRDKAVTLRDAMFMCHPKATSKEMAVTLKQLADDTLPTPDTWEVALSSGADKRQTWERLLREKKLGGLALLRNLRNMLAVGVDVGLIRQCVAEHKFDRVLPFRFIAAAKYAPQLEPELEQALFRNVAAMPKFTGKTIVLIDTSGSMSSVLSAKSDMCMIDAASALAMIVREACDDVAVYTFNYTPRFIPPRRGFALRDAIGRASGGTALGASIKEVVQKEKGATRLIVITDEQSSDTVGYPQYIDRGYIINVAPYAKGVGYGKWMHINGFSERIIDFIQQVEKEF